MRIVGLVPARGGSKGIHNKNITDLGGKPLIYYTLHEASKVSSIQRLFISTDSEIIRSICTELGFTIPFLRDKDLARDETKTVDVVLNVLDLLEKRFGEIYDYVCLLQPTSPFRIAEDIQRCVDIVLESGCDSVVSLAEVDEPHPFKMKVINNGIVEPFISGSDSSVPRQSLPPVYALNGAIYFCKTELLYNTHNFFSKNTVAYVMPSERSININNQMDLELAKVLLQKFKEQPGVV